MDIFGTIVLFCLLLFLAIAIPIGIIRWVLRINDIVDYLKRLANKLAPPPPPLPPPPPPPPPVQAECDRCHNSFPLYELTGLKIGKRVCPTCRAVLKKM